MLPIVTVHRLASEFPPYLVTVSVLAAAVLLALIFGLIRRGRPFAPNLAAIVYVLAAMVSALPRGTLGSAGWIRPVSLVTAALALMVHILVTRTPADVPDEPPGSPRAARIYLLLTLLIAAVLLFYRLGTYYSVLVAWEATVLDGFAAAFQLGQTALSYAAQRFLWDDGILSAGNTSLFYGAPTYALQRTFGFSPLTMRLSAAVATLLSIGVTYALIGRAFGRIAGAAAAMLLALNPAVLFYGRYGSSPAGTLLAVLLALYCVWLFLERDRWAWWMGPIAGVALFVATLQYAPARIVVLILLGVIAVVVVVQWRRLWWQRGVGLLALIAVLAWARNFEVEQHRDHLFLNARGETFLHFLQHPATIKGLIGRDVTSWELRPGQLSLPDKAALLVGVLQITVPQYAELLEPRVSRAARGLALNFDPPPLSLYYAPAAIFILWGMAYSMAHLTDWRHFCLLVWVAASSVPLLLTNRVDAHRMMLFVIPMSVWAALGIREGVRVLHRSLMPLPLQHAIAAALIITIVYDSINVLYANPDTVKDPPAGESVAAEIASIPGPVVLGWDWDHREVGWVQLSMLERTRHDPSWSGTMLPEGILRGVSSVDANEPTEYEIRNLLRVLVGKTTVLLAPAEKYRKVSAALQRRGVRVSERGTNNFRFFRLDTGAETTGVPDEAIKPLPTIVIPPTPTPIPLRSGPQISLSDLKPIKVEFGFAPPQVDREWDNPPIVLGGVRYDRGIGMHAWARMTYAVPPRAVEFQAIVGLADKVKECGRGAVIFEVRDEKGTELATSGLVESTTDPTPIHADVRGKQAITLIVTDAGNGIDCDHADWALPSFLLEP